MSVRGVLASGRRRSLILLIDECVIKRVTGSTTDPATDVIVPIYTTIYTGPCRVKPNRTPVARTAGDSPLEVQRYVVQLPWNATGRVQKDDLYVATVCDDAWLVERSADVPLTVLAVDYSGTTTKRHITVEDRG
ncbi:MAG: DUF6093 family protein [Gaiellaceae bacterium]